MSCCLVASTSDYCCPSSRFINIYIHYSSSCSEKKDAELAPKHTDLTPTRHSRLLFILYIYTHNYLNDFSLNNSDTIDFEGISIIEFYHIPLLKNSIISTFCPREDKIVCAVAQVAHHPARRPTHQQSGASIRTKTSAGGGKRFVPVPSLYRLTRPDTYGP